MFQGPKGYIAQMCEVHLQYGNSTTKWPFYTFFDLIPLNTYLFSLGYNIKSFNYFLEIIHVFTI